jgi:hypothetical protein
LHFTTIFQEATMPKTIVLDEWQLSVLIPASLDERGVRAVRRRLKFAAVRAVILDTLARWRGRQPGLEQVTFRLHR